MSGKKKAKKGTQGKGVLTGGQDPPPPPPPVINA